jgi:hypothetical protein
MDGEGGIGRGGIRIVREGKRRGVWNGENERVEEGGRPGGGGGGGAGR